MSKLNGTRVFCVAMSALERDGLDVHLGHSGISLTPFRASGPCREAILTRPCHVLVVNLGERITEGLQLLGDPDPMVAYVPKLAVVRRGDIPTAVQAIRAGAANCLEHPVDVNLLGSEIKVLLDRSNVGPPRSASALTRMEKTVLSLILAGKTNQEAAHELHRSPRTIEVHRRHAMAKLGVTTVVDLVRTAASIGLLDN